MVNPVTAVFGVDGEVMVAELVVVHKPLPADGVFPVKLVVPTLAHIC